MGNNKASSRTARPAWVHKPRVASFTIKTVKGKRVFTPANERAKTKIARKAGRAGTRSTLSASDLKPFQGYYKLRQRTSDGVLKPIRL